MGQGFRPGAREQGRRGRPRPFPDWTGKTVVIAASGPSQRKEDIEKAKGKAVVIVINDTWKLAPWADVLYACDEKWWKYPGKAPTADEFTGLRVIGKGEFPGCVSANVRVTAHMIWTGNTIGGGGNSGFQAVNLAAKHGAKRILLLGFDYRGSHWFGAHPPGLSNPPDHTMARWISCMNGAAVDLKKRGVEVINCSRETALLCFPRKNIRAVL